MPSNLGVDVEIPTSPVPVKADGVFHAVYELHLTNFSSHELHLREIDVTDASGRIVLAKYEGQGLIDALGRFGAQADLVDKRFIAAGLSAIAFLDVTAASRERMPLVLSHRLVFEPVPGLSPPDTTIDGIHVAVSPRSPIVLAPPLGGSGWVASHALSNTSEHRRSVVISSTVGTSCAAFRDRLDSHRSQWATLPGDPAKNANWAAYGAPVLAVADGRVADLKDGVPENDPTSDTKAVPINLETATGNYIVLDLGGGQFALYAHLKPTSLSVRIGDRVRQGQVLALVGNSGNADAPHLRFHVMNAASPLAAEGLPYVFGRFSVEGKLPSLTVPGGWQGWQRPPSGAADTRANELPTENEVIDFGGD